MKNDITCIIIDDEPDAIELLASRLALLRKNVRVTATSMNWEDALRKLQAEQYDLLFLDVNMPGKSGLELLKLIPRAAHEVIFVTAHEEYAIKAFSLGSSGYILKPLDDEQLVNAVDIAIERINAKAKPSIPQARQNDKIGIPNASGVDYIPVADILYLESQNKYTRIVTTGRDYLSSSNLGRFQEQLAGQPFFQVHRSFVINMDAILRYESSGIVIMTNKDEIPVSRNMRTEFLELLGI